MPTVIPADRWDFDPARIDTGFQPNHGFPITTDALLNSMAKLAERPEMQELDRMILKSDLYLPGKINA